MAATCGSTRAGLLRLLERRGWLPPPSARSPETGRDRNDRRAASARAAWPDQDRPDRVHAGHRPGQRWLCRKSFTAGWQRHRLYHFRAFVRRQMAGDAERGDAGHDTGGGHAERGSPGLERLFSSDPRHRFGKGVEVTPAPANPAEIEAALSEFARGRMAESLCCRARLSRYIAGRSRPNVAPSAALDLPGAAFPANGGLMSYGPEISDKYRQRPAMSIAS